MILNAIHGTEAEFLREISRIPSSAGRRVSRQDRDGHGTAPDFRGVRRVRLGDALTYTVLYKSSPMFGRNTYWCL